MQWSLLLAVAAMTGYLLQRHIGLPKVVGTRWWVLWPGLAGFSWCSLAAAGHGLFMLELGISIVLFECGGRIPLPLVSCPQPHGAGAERGGVGN